MAIVPSFLIYVLWKTAFQVVYICLPAPVCSVLNVLDRVRTVKVLYWTAGSILWDVYMRTLTDFPLCIMYRVLVASSEYTRTDTNNRPANLNQPPIQYEGVLISPWPDQEGHKLQRPNSGFIQHTPHEA